MLQAVEKYKQEVARYGAEALIENRVVELAETVGYNSQCTLLECHLARSLRKSAGDRLEALSRYLKLYALVKESDVHPVLWAAAQNIVGSTTG